MNIMYIRSTAFINNSYHDIMCDYLSVVLSL